MKAMIIYSSPKGRCRKVAESIAKHCRLDVYDVKEAPDCNDIELLVMVSGAGNSGEDDEMIEAYVKRQKDNFIKYAGLVTLDSLWKNFSPAAIYNINSRKILLRKILKEKGVEFIDEHKCLTQFSISYIGHPNKRDMEKSNEWVEKMINALDNK